MTGTSVTEPPLQKLADQAVAAAARLGGDVEQVNVAAVNAKAGRNLYATRQKIYPKLAHGKFRTIKWVVMALTLGTYYLLPWIRLERGPDLPNQAFLIDFAHQRLFLGPIEIWAQEFYLVTGILVLAALGLFLVTALSGRVWCGYACPQTVWTDLMIMVERIWQGDRNARIKLDKAPWTFDKIWRKTGTHLTWLLIGLATGGVFVFYFRDAPTLAGELLTGTAPAVAWVFLGLFTATTYLLGGLAREQVCTYMCPWPRIQGAMFDADSFLVSYRPHRGEPRGTHKKGATWEGRGDCVDCRQCVAVCPMGIDIRDGPQLECIQCALCIDACNAVMAKVGRPRLLVAYDTFNMLEAEAAGKKAPIRVVRPRTALYAGLIVLVAGIMLAALLNRSFLDVNVLPDRNPLFVRLSDGSIRNGFTVKILNKQHEPRRFRLRVEGLPEARLAIVGSQEDAADTVIEVKTDALQEIRLYVTVPSGQLATLKAEATPFDIVVSDEGDKSERRRHTEFRSPRQ